MNEDEYQEVTQIGKCIVSVNRNSDLRIECEEPITEIDIEKSDLNLVSGVSDVVEQHAEVIKDSKKENDEVED